MEEIALITANFGGIDDVQPLPDQPGVKSVYYTEEQVARKANPASLNSWDSLIFPDYPIEQLGPRLRSKFFKLQIHKLEETAQSRWLGWADSCVRFKSLNFLQKAVDRFREVPERSRILLIPHYKRKTVRDEYAFLSDSIRRGNDYARARYSIRDMTRKVRFFEQSGLSLDSQLWCSTVWIMERNSVMCGLCDEWWDHTIRFGGMDQLSLGVLIQKHNIKPLAFNIHLLNNRFFDWIMHPRLM